MALPEFPSRALNIGPGLEKAVKDPVALLFRGFNPVTWLAIAVMVLFESCGSSGNFGAKSEGAKFPSGGVFDGLAWSIVEILIAVVATVVSLAITVGLIYLSSRATMMFIRAVATRDAGLVVNWRATARPGLSLFRFQIAVAAGVLALLVVASAILWVFGIGPAVLKAAGTVVAVVALFVAVILVFALMLMSCLLRNLVAPLMWKFDMTCVEAWKYFLPVAARDAFAVAIFLGIRLLFGLIIGFVSLVVGIFTCCVGLLPVINQLILAPLHVYERAYSLHVVESLGPEFRMFGPTEPVAEPQAAPAQDGEGDG